MFKPESWQSHNEYRTIVTTIGHRLSRNNPKYSFNEYDEERQKLLNLNLDPLLDYIPTFYSKGGRPASHQAQILRSLILFVLLFNKTKARTSLTLWVRKVLPNSISLAVLIGCASLEELPPLGSYYDFMNRFWTSPGNRYSRTALLPAGKNGKKPKKLIGADGKLAEPEDSCTITAKDIVNDILDGKPAADNPEAALQKIFSILAVLPSIRLGLIDTQNLTLSGDGTTVVSHSSPYGRHLSSCGKDCPYRDSCGRHYSDPDASWGWDSDLDSFYFGYTLFQLSCHNTVLHTDIPLLLRFTSAKRHDSVSFLVAFHELEEHMPALSIKFMCLDSAMDNLPTYRLLKDRNISALIDLNSKSGHPKTIHDNIRIDKNGAPVCAAGLPMVPNGNDYSSKGHIGCQMWRCSYGKDHKTKCKCSCTSSKYGRVIKTRPEWDIRLYTDIPRGSEAYKKIYKQRTATERINNRILNDYGLHRMFIHTKEHYSFMTTMIGICIHLDARYKQQMQTAA